MRLRTAKKIVKAVGTSRELAYSDHQIGKAQDRIDRTRSAKELNSWWYGLMDRLGVDGRAELLTNLGRHDLASDLLARNAK